MSARCVDWRPSPALYPFASRWLDGAPGRMHYLDEGRGRPILLLHGNPTWSFLYRKLIPPLVDGGLRCVAPDYFGFGLSAHPDGFGYTAAEQAAAVLALVERLDLRDLLVMGQDWGGPIALWVAARAPERVAGVVLGNTFAWPMAGLMRPIAALVRTGVAYRYLLRKDGFVARTMRGMVRAPLTDEELEHYQRPAQTAELRRGVAEFPRQLAEARPWLADLERDARARLGEKPLLLFRAGKNRLASSRATLRRFGGLFPRNAVVDLPSAGHYFQEDAPAETAATIRAWVQSMPGGK